MPDGSKWDVSSDIIAKDRASYYAEVDSRVEGKNFDACLNAEFEQGMNEPDTLIDWAENNMNWADVAPHARKADTPPMAINWQEGWVNGHKEIVER